MQPTMVAPQHLIMPACPLALANVGRREEEAIPGILHYNLMQGELQALRGSSQSPRPRARWS